MNLIGKLRKIQASPRFVLCQIAIDRLTFRLVQVRRFNLLEYVGLPRSQNTRGPGRVRQGRPADIPGMALLEGRGKEHVFQDRLSRGDCFAVAEHHGTIVGYEWFTTSGHEEQRYRYPVPVPKNSIYVYDAYIDPGFRMSGIWLKLKNYMGDQMRTLGREHLITLIDADNTMSLNTHLRFGFRIVRSVDFIRVGRKRFFRERNPDGSACRTPS